MAAAEIGKDTLLKMYRTMQTIRQFEERLRDLFKEGKVPGFVHVSIGEEATPTGVCATLTDKDYITSTHRGHGHLIAKGGKLKPMMAEIFGKKTGYCKGKGGSMHIADRARGHDMPGVVVNGNDVVEVHETMLQAVERARKGEGPTLIECKTYRWEGHVVGEEAFLGKRGYRSQEEIAEWKKRCPLVTFERRFLEARLVTQAELDAVKAAVKREVEEAVAFAIESPLPKPEEALEDMFSAA